MAQVLIYFPEANTKLDAEKQQEVEKKIKGFKTKLAVPEECFNPDTEKVINPAKLGPLLLELVRKKAPVLAQAPKVTYVKLDSIKTLGVVKVMVETELYGPTPCHIELLAPPGFKSKKDSATDDDEEDEDESSETSGGKKTAAPQPNGGFSQMYQAMLKKSARAEDRKITTAIANLDGNREATKTLELAKICVQQLDATVVNLRSEERGASRPTTPEGVQKLKALAMSLGLLSKAIKDFARKHAAK